MAPRRELCKFIIVAFQGLFLSLHYACTSVSTSFSGGFIGLKTIFLLYREQETHGNLGNEGGNCRWLCGCSYQRKGRLIASWGS